MASLRLLVLSLFIVLSVQSQRDDEFNKLFSVQVLKEGDNTNFPPSGVKAKVHYTGTFADGRKFDSSVDRNQPFVFGLGQGQVIQCWDKVVQSMSKGEKVKVVCPSRFAYGERGAGNVIPPNTDIHFEIELLDWI